MSHINNEHWEELVDLFGDDMTDLINDFVKDSAVRIESLKNSIESGDNGSGSNEAHTLKGASANLGAEILSKHCYKMQETCHANMISHAHNILTDIEAEFAHVAKEIEERLAKL